MRTQFFEQLATKENGQFYFKDEDISIGHGVRSPNVVYKVTFEYKSNKFEIYNRTGTAYIGKITCILSDTLQPIPFKVSTTSHFTNLFLWKKDRFKITSRNKNIVHFLQNNVSLEKLKAIADADDFTPTITCEKDIHWNITTKYHLEFDDWTAVVTPLVALYKNLIDAFEDRIANIPHKSYRDMVENSHTTYILKL